MAVIILLALIALGPLYAVASGRATASRLRELGDDLRHGRPRGLAILAMAVVLFVVFQLVNTID